MIAARARLGVVLLAELSPVLRSTPFVSSLAAQLTAQLNYIFSTAYLSQRNRNITHKDA